jgi:CPA1 family monovalent cation:H+ antiporter
MLLFWESYQASVTFSRRYGRPILLNGIYLVVVSAAPIAWVAHGFGFTWPAAWRSVPHWPLPTRAP